MTVPSGITTNGSLTCTSGAVFGPGSFVGTDGQVFLGNNAGTGNVYIRTIYNNGTDQMYFNSSGNLTISGPTGVKSTGTTWANPSDARIKEVTGDYETGLDAILGLQVRRFRFLGNEQPADEDPNDPAVLARAEKKMVETVPYENSPHYRLAVAKTECVGLIAQEAELVMPDIITQSTMLIDGVEVNDFRTLDADRMIWAVVNAIKELNARLEALEA